MEKKLRGIVLAAGQGTRLAPLTNYVNKHLLPVYNKPMIYYPLTTLILAGCRELCLIINEQDLNVYQKIQKRLSQLNLSVELVIQDPKKIGLPSALLHGEEFADGHNVLLMLGDNIFFGNNFISNLRSNITEQACIVLKKVKDPSSYGVIKRDSDNQILEFVEKPKTFISNEVVTGLYYFPNNVFDICKSLRVSSRNETEITDLLNRYLKMDCLTSFTLPRGVAWLDTGTVENLSNSGSFVRTIEARSIETFGYIEEAALSKGFIDEDHYRNLVSQMQDSNYKDYLETLLDF